MQAARHHHPTITGVFHLDLPPGPPGQAQAQWRLSDLGMGRIRSAKKTPIVDSPVLPKSIAKSAALAVNATISKDCTGGEDVRKAKLLAAFGERLRASRPKDVSALRSARLRGPQLKQRPGRREPGRASNPIYEMANWSEVQKVEVHPHHMSRRHHHRESDLSSLHNVEQPVRSSRTP